MNEVNNPLDTLNDLLNTDLSNVDTSFPVLKRGQKELLISDIKVTDSKKGGKNLVMTLKTTFPDTTVRGREIGAGFSLRHLISLTPSEKYDPRQNIAALKEAAFGDKNLTVNPQDFIGRTVVAIVTVDNSPEYGEQNSITRFVKKV